MWFWKGIWIYHKYSAYETKLNVVHLRSSALLPLHLVTREQPWKESFTRSWRAAGIINEGAMDQSAKDGYIHSGTQVTVSLWHVEQRTHLEIVKSW
jgi:hypothetical protein